MDQRYQVKQYVSRIDDKGKIFNVYKTGDPQYYLFKMVHNDCETGLEIAVKKADLKTEIAHALAHGISLTIKEGGDRN